MGVINHSAVNQARNEELRRFCLQQACVVVSGAYAVEDSESIIEQAKDFEAYVRGEDGRDHQAD